MKRLFFATSLDNLDDILEVLSCNCASAFDSCPVVGFDEQKHSFEAPNDESGYSVFLVNDQEDDPLADFETFKASDFLIYHKNTLNDKINSKFKWKKDSHHLNNDSSLYYKLFKLIAHNPEITSSDIIDSVWPSSMAEKESITDFVMKLLGSYNKPELPEVLMDLKDEYVSVSSDDVSKLTDTLRIFVNECLARIK